MYTIVYSLVPKSFIPLIHCVGGCVIKLLTFLAFHICVGRSQDGVLERRKICMHLSVNGMPSNAPCLYSDGLFWAIDETNAVLHQVYSNNDRILQ